MVYNILLKLNMVAKIVICSHLSKKIVGNILSWEREM